MHDDNQFITMYGIHNVENIQGTKYRKIEVRTRRRNGRNK